MAEFTVNGKKFSVNEEKKLIDFLRNDLLLTSVKNGCSEGSCGSCTIIVDGATRKACTLTTEKVAGKAITTVEGLSEYEQNVFSYAFGKAGAVQCGFCTPGMILCAKNLLDKNADPSEDEIKHAIRNNTCRCTGYVKIVKAIRIAAEYIRDNKNPETTESCGIGKNLIRLDVREKATGQAVYTDDIIHEKQLQVVALRSAYPRAKVLSVNTEKAKQAQGIKAVITAEDIPGDKVVGHLIKDWDAMIAVGETTRYPGDVIALVAADTYEHALKAKSMIEVEYQELKPVLNPYDAAKEDAPLIHENGNLLGQVTINRGDVEKAISESDYVLSEHFSTPWTEHAFLEPECAVAYPGKGGKIMIFSSDQGVYDTQRETAPMLGLPYDDVIVENCYVGGAFGGKEDVTVQHLAALAAKITGMPCKMKLTRDESIQVHPKRHPMELDLTLGCTKEGKINGLDVKIITDNGAYASLGLPVLQRACTHASGPYHFTNFRVDGKAYYTNNPPAGAFRGFGVTQSCFAMETLLNRMADKIGISHWDIRYINAIRPNQELPNGQITDEATGLVETLEAVKKDFFENKNAGIACAMKNAGVGVGIKDYGRVNLEIVDSKVLIHCAGSCLGQGLNTVLKQIVCETTGLSPDSVLTEHANTHSAPDSGTTSGSRHTTISGEAARQASIKLKKALESQPLKNLEGQSFKAEYLAETDPFGSKKSNPKSHIAYGYATQVCIIDEETLKVKKIVAAHDVGKAVNPLNLEGQIEGGVVMGLGYALREKLTLENGKPKEHFGTLGLFRANEVPEIEVKIIEKPGLGIAYGAKGIGEITCIPTAPAVNDAYCRTDGKFRNTLPLKFTPYLK